MLKWWSKGQIRQLSEKMTRISFSQFLGAFGKLRKATINFVMSVRSHGTTRLPLDGFSWNLIFEDLSKICETIQVSLKSDKNNSGTLVKTNIHFWSHLAHFFLEWETFATELVEKVKTHILCSIFFFFNYGLWCGENILQQGRTQMTIWRMRIARWIPKATNSHTQNM